MMKKIYKVEKFNSKNDWLNHRGIGGSSASALLNQNPYLSPNELYDSIVYPHKNIDYQTESTIRGTKLEPNIRNEFAILHKDLFKVTNPPKNNWLFRRIDKPYLTASLDGLLKDLKTGETGILEIKTKEIRKDSEAVEWENGLIPQNYYIQCLHYLMVTGFTFCYLVAHLIKRDYQTGEVEWIKVNTQKIYREGKEEEIKKLEEVETRFYLNCQKRIRPKVIIKALRLKE